MSKEAARAFYDKVKASPELANKVTERGDQLSDADMVRIAGDAGFECTAEELDAVGTEIASELSDDQLNDVAGGSGPADAVGSKSLKIKGGIGDTSIKVKPGLQNLAWSAYKVSAAKGTKS
jgi:predicted ribosomally synthesized peptide with nif11-like leader